jgi:spermidine synthase
MKYFYEMLVHVPLSTHKDPQNVLVVSNEKDIKDEIAKHKVQVDFSTLSNASSKYDIIILDQNVNDELELGLVNKLLKEHGIFVMPLESLDEIKNLSSYQVVMPYKVEDKYIVFASKKYHPTANQRFHISDFLENCEYYNTQIHSASFVLPTYLNQQYKGIIKR